MKITRDIVEDHRRDYRLFETGGLYRVLKTFTDYDGVPHKAGETWVYLGYSFLPYDDGLCLYVELSGEAHVFRLQEREEAQGHVTDNLDEYFVRCEEEADQP